MGIVDGLIDVETLDLPSRERDSLYTPLQMYITIQCNSFIPSHTRLIYLI